MNTKNNQRYRDMHVRLASAMLALMQETEFEKITVRGLCEQAGVNRGTFYAHYTDLYSMLDEMEDSLNGQLLAAVDAQEPGEDLFLPYLRFIKEHRYFYRITLANRKSLPVRKTFRRLWERLALPRCLQAGVTDPERQNYYFLAFQGGVSAALSHWIFTDCAESEETLSEILRSCGPVFPGMCPWPTPAVSAPREPAP